jgi:hypothetical protein
MPGFNGKGPSGKGPLTGKGRGFCILKSSEKNPHQVQGFAGLQGVPVDQNIENNSEDNGKEVINMPHGDGTGPIGQGPGTGRGIGQGQGKGRMGGPFAAGPGGNCACPNCGATVAHVVGQACNTKSCPKCGTRMTRAM